MAEDNEINAIVAVEFLNEMGAEVDVAENGQIVVDKFASHPENYYDFILMDVQMPVMDGRKAARTIRALDRPDAGSILIFCALRRCVHRGRTAFHRERHEWTLYKTG